MMLLLAAVPVALVLCSTAALAALSIGTNGAEPLTGKHSADLINGKGGNDVLKGLAANDVYHFANGFGQDTLTELVKHKVGGKVLSGGKDSLNFSETTAAVTVYLTPEWPASGNSYGNQANAYDSNQVLHKVSLGSSPVENATGGSGSSDWVTAGGASNTLRPGGGSINTLRDFGGYNDGGSQGLPEIPSMSSDTYSGFGALPSGGRAEIADWGGADRVVMPGESSDYFVDATSLDGTSATEESLQIYNPANNTSVFVYGHFSEYSSWTSHYGMHGQIEQMVFADGIFGTAQVRAQSFQVRDLGGATGVAREAEKVAEEVRSDASADPTRPE
jgi:hypothetical protein